MILLEIFHDLVIDQIGLVYCTCSGEKLSVNVCSAQYVHGCILRLLTKLCINAPFELGPKKFRLRRTSSSTNCSRVIRAIM